MATQADYDLATAAALKVIQADEASEVPDWARGMIPADTAQKLAAAVARAVVDALEPGPLAA